MHTPAHLILTQRDTDLLVFVHTLDGCTAEHIRRRFFPKPTQGSQAACYRRISYLVSAGYLARVRLPATSGMGSGKAFLTVGPQARPIVAQVLGLTRMELARTTRLAAPRFIAHHLALCDFYLALSLATQGHPALTLVAWRGDREMKRAPIHVQDPQHPGRVIPIIPDACFTLAGPGGGEQRYLLEMDMATLPSHRLRAKLRAYLLQYSAGGTPILFVTPNVVRQQAVAGWAQAEAGNFYPSYLFTPNPAIFWLATAKEVTRNTAILSPIWQVVGRADPVGLDQVPAMIPSIPVQPISALVLERRHP